MNYLTYKYRIERQLKSYIDFLPFCTSQKQTFALLDEITDLRYKIEKIDRMSIIESHSQVRTKTIQLESDDKYSKIGQEI